MSDTTDTRRTSVGALTLSVSQTSPPFLQVYFDRTQKTTLGYRRRSREALTDRILEWAEEQGHTLDRDEVSEAVHTLLGPDETDMVQPLLPRHVYQSMYKRYAEAAEGELAAPDPDSL
jgi:hypothetical protein